MKIWIAIIFFIMISNIASAEIIVNEVMPYPIDDETLNEWIELYNNGDEPVDVNGWTIGDLDSNDTIEGGLYNKEGTTIPPRGYAILTDSETRVYDNFDIGKNAIHLYVDDSSIGNGLGNANEVLYLYNGQEIVDSLEYNTTGKGFSLAIFGSELFFADPTPGYNNSGSVELVGEGQCDYDVKIILEKTFFNNQSDFEFKIYSEKLSGEATNITSYIQIEDLYGGIVKTYIPWANDSISSHKTSSTYSPNLQEGNSYQISANISVDCIDANKENNFDYKIFSIQSPHHNSESSIEIIDVSGLSRDKAQFGDTIKVNLDVYKGNTSKRVVDVYLKGKKTVSEKSKAEFHSQFSEYSITLPLQIYSNCDGEYEEGDYDIIAEGLGEKDTYEIEIDGITDSLCKKAEAEKIDAKFDYEIVEAPELAYIGQEFPVKVRLVGDNTQHAISLSSYVYRGSKCYSDSREGNKKEIYLDSGKTQEITLDNMIKEAEPGSYKLKVVLNKDNQKTNKEIIKEIVLKQNNNPVQSSIQKKQSQNQANITKTIVTSNAVYESKQEQTKNLALYLTLFVLAFLNAVLIWKR